MPTPDIQPYASMSMRHLLAEEIAVSRPRLLRCPGNFGLFMSIMPDQQPPALPMLNHWTRLHLHRQNFAGDVCTHVAPSLPWADDAFDLVFVQHVLDLTPLRMRWIHELARCLAPGGMFVATGLHPLSIWSPWWYWRMRDHATHLTMPWQLVHWLCRAGMEMVQYLRVGRVWPGASSGAWPAASSLAMAGGYALFARKCPGQGVPIRLPARAATASVRTTLVPGTRRRASTYQAWIPVHLWGGG